MCKTPQSNPISFSGRIIKRSFDITLSTIGLIFLFPLMLLIWIAASIDTRQNGLFIQQRIGVSGSVFPLLKIRTMRTLSSWSTSVTTKNDPRITKFGRILRGIKVDELPQLLNILVGHMSFVGPRPDVAGFVDQLSGADRVILLLRPGITGPATIRFRDEEITLAAQLDPERYNREIIWPEKVRLNRQYAEQWRFGLDLKYLLATLWGRSM